jgi:hypothetical protein
MNWRLMVIVLAAVPFAMAAGCGESQKVVIYKQGQYQGKPDTQPWNNEVFKGDRAEWERQINTRLTGQNEYVRIAGGG